MVHSVSQRFVHRRHPRSRSLALRASLVTAGALALPWTALIKEALPHGVSYSEKRLTFF